MIPRKLDLDWLESSVELILSGEHRYRQQGKTVAYLMLMVGEVELGGPSNVYVYIGERTIATEKVRADFHKLITEQLGNEVITKHTQTRVDVGDQQFHFLPVHRLISNPQLFRGLSGIDRIFFDVDDSTQEKLDANGDLSALFDTILPALSYRRGDVI